MKTTYYTVHGPPDDMRAEYPKNAMFYKLPDGELCLSFWIRHDRLTGVHPMHRAHGFLKSLKSLDQIQAISETEAQYKELTIRVWRSRRHADKWLSTLELTE